MPTSETLFTDVPAKVWEAITGDTAITALVKPGNLIDATNNLSKLKFQINEADLPELVLWPGSYADTSPVTLQGLGPSGLLRVQLIFTDQADQITRARTLEQLILNRILKAGPHLGLAPFVMTVQRSTSGVVVTDREGQPIPTARSAMRAIGVVTVTATVRQALHELRG